MEGTLDRVETYMYFHMCEILRCAQEKVRPGRARKGREWVERGTERTGVVKGAGQEEELY